MSNKKKIGQDYIRKNIYLKRHPDLIENLRRTFSFPLIEIHRIS